MCLRPFFPGYIRYLSELFSLFQEARASTCAMVALLYAHPRRACGNTIDGAGSSSQWSTLLVLVL